MVQRLPGNATLSGMWRLAPFLLIVATVSAQQPSPPGRDGGGERDFLSRVRRLTVEGRRAGEGYWAPDGQRLVFQ
ncbi:MAG TPA: hypothetical protein VH835_02720, partial [Dongiaceae bacterium]